MGLRPAKCYRRIKRAYTRISKFKKFSFVKTKPANKVVKFSIGDQNRKFSHQVSLISKVPIQIRHNAIEASRLVVNRRLTEFLGKDYFFIIRVYPHQILRENKMLTGAGADRMQKGMQKSFGRPTGLAAQLKKKQPIFTVSVDEKNIDLAKAALKKACPRLSGAWGIEIKKL